MELPDDVLQLIREFSKPCFKHHAIYHRTLQIMGVKSLPKLKECLLSVPEHILPALHQYDQAHLKFEDTLQQFLHATKTSINYSKQMEVFRTRHDLCEAGRTILRLIETIPCRFLSNSDT
jgi:hypothetical protein